MLGHLFGSWLSRQCHRSSQRISYGIGHYLNSADLIGESSHRWCNGGRKKIDDSVWGLISDEPTLGKRDQRVTFPSHAYPRSQPFHAEKKNTRWIKWLLIVSWQSLGHIQLVDTEKPWKRRFDQLLNRWPNIVYQCCKRWAVTMSTPIAREKNSSNTTMS